MPRRNRIIRTMYGKTAVK